MQGVPGSAYGILLLATGCLGFGFGTVVMALNTYAEEFSPGREDRAVLSLNALLGAGGQTVQDPGLYRGRETFPGGAARL